MHSITRHKMWFTVLLLLIMGAGCCDVRTAGVTAPTISAVSPVTGSTGTCPNTTVTATFSEAMSASSVNTSTFTLAGPGAAAVAGAVTYDASSNTATFTPSAPLAVNTLYTATIAGVKDSYGNVLASNYTWTFTTAANACHAPPVISTVTPPTGSVGICPNTPITVTFSEPMNPLTINASTFTLSQGVTGVVTADATNTIFTFTPASSLALNQMYTATITTGAQDTYGNALAANFVWSFTTAANGCSPAPVIASVTPPTGSAGVCPNAVITATFSEAMNPLTLNSTTFTLTPGVVGTVTADSTNKIFTFTPSTGLALGQTYSATISTGAQDTFGNALASNYVWSFTTGGNGCNLPPVVASVTPPNGSTGVCPNTIVSAVFGEAMSPATINVTTFTVTGLAGAAVAGTVSYSTATNTAIFTPTVSLALNTTFTATITTGVMDLFGNSLPQNYVWSFTTGATSCLPPLPPASVTPPSGAVGVCPSAVVTATFPQPMDPATINTSTFTLTGPGLTPVVGLVTRDSTNMIFTFTPSSALAVSTLYTATITTGAKDPYANALASNFVWSFTTASSACVPGPHPTVVSVSPPQGSAGVCPSTLITATFSQAMDPSTINTTTFTVAPGVTGTVTLDGTGTIATFTPAAPLALATTYTPNVSTGVKDADGSALVAHFFWSFTTAMYACQAAVPLGTAANFEILAGSTVTNNGPTIISGGNLGLSPGSAITGFPPGVLLSPAVMDDTDAIAAQAEFDLTFAYNYAAGLPNGAVLPADLSGLTLVPGLYTNAGTVMLSAGQVVLDAQGQANAVFIFQIGTTLTTIGSTQVILANGAQAANVYWQVGSSATLGTYSAFVGTIMAYQAITLESGASLEGRALARNAAVTMDTNTVTSGITVVPGPDRVRRSH